jgi:hypothetical protein
MGKLKLQKATPKPSESTTKKIRQIWESLKSLKSNSSTKIAGRSFLKRTFSCPSAFSCVS